MQCVIVNDKGEIYGGFSSETSKPVWFKTKRPGCDMAETMADSVLRQLQGLGFAKVAKRDANGVTRKWVPSDLDATAV